MNEAQQNFRERLLNLQKASPSEKYLREVAELHQKQLSPTQRAFLVLVTIATLAAAVFMGWLATFPPRPLPMLSRIGLGSWSISSLTASLLASGLVKGSVLRRRMTPNRIVVFVFKNLVIFAITMLALMGQVPDAGTRVIMGSVVLFCFGMGCVYLILARLDEMELRSREKLLEIELELQQVAEEIKALRQ